jgi:hypothetical protein
MREISLRLILALAVLVGLSAALAWATPDDVLARPIFQSPIGTPGITPTLTITGTRPAGLPSPTTQLVTATQTVTSAAPSPQPPTAAPPAAPAVAPPGDGKAPGFLPPPTLSAPGGRPQPLLPGPGQPLVAPPAPTLAPRATPAAANQTGEASSLARLIDAAIIALSYVWLCCGIFVLIGTTLLLVWLARGKARAR